MRAVERLLKKHFVITSFDKVLAQIAKKQASFFEENLFLDKASYLHKITALGEEIDELADAYSQAQEAAKSGSIIQSFASAGLGSIQKEYIQKRKAMVHHLSLFLKKK
ncbi:hypothetical protein [Xanthomarina gelatinilytica]|uniref:hypothetical protein n=1 Tax=Xanthomarina gelatinilytica TaxID=1137281 RepID=UPI003AA9CA60